MKKIRKEMNLEKKEKENYEERENNLIK